MIHTIKENEINVDGDSFTKDMAFIIEVVRAALLREMSLNLQSNLQHLAFLAFTTINSFSFKLSILLYDYFRRKDINRIYEYLTIKKEI